METYKTAYFGYMIFCTLLLIAIFGTAYLQFSQDMTGAYKIFSYTCHQKLSRSICLFKNDAGNMWLSDCTTQTGSFISDAQDRLRIDAFVNDIKGYKVPVCARDIGLYLGLLLGGLCYPLMFELNSRQILPTKYLLIALIPMGIDGTTQLISELGVLPYVYESTNMLRLATGLIAGIAAAIYAIPILVNMLSKDEGKPDTTPKK